MNDRLDIDLARIGKKWVACFDLLGFSKLTNNSINHAFNHVERCLLEAKQKSLCDQKLRRAWFSDTFLFYSEDDSSSSFHAIDFLSKNFFEMAILRNIPVRGAMACDEFYADETNRIFIGRALVDAFRFGEKCNWVGFVLCPSAVCQIEKLNTSAPRDIVSNGYKLWNVPTKQKIVRGAEPSEEAIVECSEKMQALLWGVHLGLGNGGQFMRELKAMSERTDSPEDKVKYTNSIKFLNHFGIPK
jgi:hypothetical protein